MRASVPAPLPAPAPALVRASAVVPLPPLVFAGDRGPVPLLGPRLLLDGAEGGGGDV